MLKIKNAAIGVANPTEWFQPRDIDTIKPSAAEIKIRTALEKTGIEFYHEVSFRGLKHDSGHFARFDFWIPSINTAIEYDGEKYHESDKAKEKDTLKNIFCKNNGIILIRYNKMHYYRIENLIPGLIKRSEKTTDTHPRKILKAHKKNKRIPKPVDEIEYGHNGKIIKPIYERTYKVRTWKQNKTFKNTASRNKTPKNKHGK